VDTQPLNPLVMLPCRGGRRPARTDQNSILEQWQPVGAMRRRGGNKDTNSLMSLPFPIASQRRDCLLALPGACRYGPDATAAGQALVFSWPPDRPAEADACASHDGQKMHLGTEIYKLDKRPLLEGCLCYGCRHHSRCSPLFLHFVQRRGLN
jgi:hypothetical protein